MKYKFILIHMEVAYFDYNVYIFHHIFRLFGLQLIPFIRSYFIELSLIPS